MKFSPLPLAELEVLAGMGRPEAQFELGIRHLHGHGLPADVAQAVTWLRRAAEHSHPGAMDSLGVRYATGQGVPKDDAEAVRWFRRAAELGYAVAQFNLGLAHVHGQGVPSDYGEAFVWFSLAAEQGDEIAAESRDRIAEALDGRELHTAKIRYHEAYRRLRPRAA